ncbi:MDIS1-interacting receptor like kinase 2-like [Gossypium hirsutum]|uniref:non-specific serine/threonine protein kinase n=1 Tax=Gossypium hirsutum TaxID=3635 RepID=A0ABM3ABY5_GOSHI|nr:MDIS1-interacting receptor like kinase 2-like [Gossypium hirsutum]
MFPLLLVSGLSISSIALLFAFKKRKIDTDEERQSNASGEIFFTVTPLNGRILYEEIIRAAKDFDAQYCIGKGGYGNVYKAEPSSGYVVAVKKFHPLHTGRSFLVYKYLERGSLASGLRNDEESKKLDWNKRTLALLSFSIQTHPIRVILLEHTDTLHQLSYTMQVTEKCDVFSFGVLALELIVGAYPGEFLSNLSILTAESIPLNNVLDQRLTPPLPEVVNKLVFILKLVVSCFSAVV